MAEPKFRRLAIEHVTRHDVSVHEQVACLSHLASGGQATGGSYMVAAAGAVRLQGPGWGDRHLRLCVVAKGPMRGNRLSAPATNLGLSGCSASLGCLTWRHALAGSLQSQWRIGVRAEGYVQGGRWEVVFACLWLNVTSCKHLQGCAVCIWRWAWLVADVRPCTGPCCMR